MDRLSFLCGKNPYRRKRSVQVERIRISGKNLYKRERMSYPGRERYKNVWEKADAQGGRR